MGSLPDHPNKVVVICCWRVLPLLFQKKYATPVNTIKQGMPVLNRVSQAGSLGPSGSFLGVAGLLAKSICTSDGREGNVGILNGY